ncbi:MAG: F-box protein [Chlamydiota bacterium]|nr:F-box protein [Chlamydiota bacterium]
MSLSILNSHPSNNNIASNLKSYRQIFPNEIWSLIFSHLPENDLRNLSLVSKNFYWLINYSESTARELKKTYTIARNMLFKNFAIVDRETENDKPFFAFLKPEESITRNQFINISHAYLIERWNEYCKELTTLSSNYIKNTTSGREAKKKQKIFFDETNRHLKSIYPAIRDSIFYQNVEVDLSFENNQKQISDLVKNLTDYYSFLGKHYYPKRLQKVTSMVNLLFHLYQKPFKQTNFPLERIIRLFRQGDFFTLSVFLTLHLHQLNECEFNSLIDLLTNKAKHNLTYEEVKAIYDTIKKNLPNHLSNVTRFNDNALYAEAAENTCTNLIQHLYESNPEILRSAFHPFQRNIFNPSGYSSKLNYFSDLIHKISHQAIIKAVECPSQPINIEDFTNLITHLLDNPENDLFVDTLLSKFPRFNIELTPEMFIKNKTFDESLWKLLKKYPNQLTCKMLIHHMITRSDKNTVFKLIESELFDLNKTDAKYPENALMIACKHGKVSIIKKLVGEKTILINAKNQQELDALYFTCRSKKYSKTALSLLLKHKNIEFSSLPSIMTELLNKSVATERQQSRSQPFSILCDLLECEKFNINQIELIASNDNHSLKPFHRSLQLDLFDIAYKILSRPDFNRESNIEGCEFLSQILKGNKTSMTAKTKKLLSEKLLKTNRKRSRSSNLNSTSPRPKRQKRS